MSNLLDTDWAISYLNRVPRTVSRMDELRPEDISISIVSVAELYERVLNSNNPLHNENRMTEFLGQYPVISLDVPICRIFGVERARLRAAGTLIQDMDLLSGATALRHNLTLLSNNRRHFERLQGLRIISV